MTAHEHNHDHEVAQTPDSARDHAHTHSAAGRTLLLALVLTLGFSVVELLAGWRSGSLALLADAGHMVTDGASLGISALAAWLAARPPSRRHTYGLGRAELLAALVNALSMLAVVFVIATEAWHRLQSPGQIDGATVSVVAVLGLVINLVVAWVLSRGERNLNVRAALLHVMGCHRPAHRSQLMIGTMEPGRDRRNGATHGSAHRRQRRIGVMEPASL